MCQQRERSDLKRVGRVQHVVHAQGRGDTLVQGRGYFRKGGGEMRARTGVGWP